MSKYDKASLPLDLEILDAGGLAKDLGQYETLHIKYNHERGHYYLETRRYASVEVEWDFHFKVTLEQAREIVKRGYATWWFAVPEAYR